MRFGSLISFSTLIWILTPLHEHSHDNKIIQVIFVAVFASLVGTVISTLYDFFWFWQCRYIVRDLEAKFGNGVLLPEDKRKLKTRLWKCLRADYASNKRSRVTLAGEVQHV